MLDELLELKPTDVLLVLSPTVLELDDDEVLLDETLDELVLLELTPADVELVLNAAVLLVLNAAVDVELVETLDALDCELVLRATVLLLVSSIDSTTGAYPLGCAIAPDTNCMSLTNFKTLATPASPPRVSVRYISNT